MQLMVYIYYSLLFFQNYILKCTSLYQRRSFNSFSLFYIFISQCFLFYYPFSISLTKKNHIYNLYCISYTFSFCQVMYYIMSEICNKVYTKSTRYCNTQCHPKPNQKSKIRLNVQNKRLLFQTKVNNKNTCKVVSEMHYLKNGV